eukprot:4115335-Prymnesium_polylepis.1
MDSFSGTSIRPPLLSEGVRATANGEVMIKSGLSLTWFVLGADLIRFELALSSMAWLAVGVSKDGNMVTDAFGNPAASKAVVGTAADGVLQYTLVAQDVTGVIVDPVQNLSNASFVQHDGTTTLSFGVPLSWIHQHKPGAESTFFIWSHGEPEVQAFGYHKQEKGRFQLSRSQLIHSNSSASVDAADTSTCTSTTLLESARCFMNYDSMAMTDYGHAASAYDESLDLSSEYRISWSVFPGIDGYIDIMLQARTLGWVGFGLMKNDMPHGMLATDMFVGFVKEGVPSVFDAYAEAIAPPILEKDMPGHVDNLYDIRGFENETTGVTTLQFKRKLMTDGSDHWDRSIVAGSMACVFAFNSMGSDQLNMYHGPSRGFANVVFYRPAQEETCEAGYLRINDGHKSFCKQVLAHLFEPDAPNTVVTAIYPRVSN